MKFRIIYPRWAKLHQQTEFHLPPHGPVVFAASLPADIEVDFTDENLQTIDFDDPVDMVGISMMLTIQIKRGWEIAEAYRARGIKVICGGRLGGAEMARREWQVDGRVPRNTLRANIDYGTAEALTGFGRIGVKVWIYTGDKLDETQETADVYVS